MTTVAVEPRPPPVSLRFSRPCGKVVPGGRLGTVEVATKPELAASTTQVPPLILARAVPLPVPVAALGAEQLAGLPPPEPVQVQDQGDAALTALAVPVVHKPLTGIKALAATVAQTPLTAATGMTPADPAE